jgi:hypothetical protein
MASSAICGRRRIREPVAGRLALAVGILISLQVVPAARAEPDQSTMRRARAIAVQGFAAYDRHDYAAAVALFSRAYELAPEPGLLYNIAQAYRQIGPSACEKALDHYRRFLATPESAHGQVTRETIDARISEMEACVERRKSDSTREPAEAAAVSAPGIEPVDQPPDDRARRTAGWVVTGAGSATLALAAVAGAIALHRRSQLHDGCRGGVCPPELSDEVTSYDRWRYTAFVAGGAGAVAVGVGVWMLVTSPRTATGTDSQVTAHRVAPWVAPNAVGVSLWF